MLSRPIVPLLTLVMSAGLALGGCGSDSPKNTDGGGVAPDGSAAGAGGSTGGAGGASTGGSGGAATGGSGGAATGGSGGAATGGAGGGGGSPNLAGCGTSGNTCTKAETDTYNQCLISKCESSYTPCIGTGWRTGSFGGLCGTWFQCVNKCGCNDINCFVACGQPSAECQSCLMTASSCQKSMCPQPACYTMSPDAGATNPGADGGAGGTCADLLKCCDKLPTPESKANCMAGAAGNNDQQCSIALAAFKGAGLCQ